jgi:hypothetical protein
MTRFWNNLHQERSKGWRDRCGPDHMVVGFTTTYAISAYHHLCCGFESRSVEVYSIQHYVMQFVTDETGQWFSQSTRTCFSELAL